MALPAGADGVTHINEWKGNSDIHIDSGPSEYCIIVTYGLIDGLHAEVLHQRLAGSLRSTVGLSLKEKREATLATTLLASRCGSSKISQRRRSEVSSPGVCPGRPSSPAVLAI